jgi:hypothetical protein
MPYRAAPRWEKATMGFSDGASDAGYALKVFDSSTQKTPSARGADAPGASASAVFL